MSAHFNGLTPAEAERLAILLEEMGETAQIIGKILRHGYNSVNPFYPDLGNNRAHLTREIGDVLVAIDLLLDARDVDENDIEDRKRVKSHKMREWLHHQP